MTTEQHQLKGIHCQTAHETTMRTVGSTLAVMWIEDHLRKGGKLSFPSLGITITREDLEGAPSTVPSKTEDNEKT